MEWALYDATVSGWEEEHRGGVDPRTWFKRTHVPNKPTKIALRLTPRLDTGAIFTTVKIEQLPPDLAMRCRKLDRRSAIPEWEKGDSFPILLARSSGQPTDKMADPYEMRDEFFELSGDLDELTDFARKWGLWDSNRIAISHNEQIAMLDRNETPCIFPHLIQQEQAEYRNALCMAPDKWLSRPKQRIIILQQSRKPYFFVYNLLSSRLESCPAAISATITLDHLNGSQFRICSRPDCRAVFKIESKHDQQYCKRACAHVMAVRANRERAKEKARREERRLPELSNRKQKRRMHDVSVSL
jgi:hypothetical protein